MMKKLIVTIGAIAFCATVSVFAQDKAADGKALYDTKKCSTCHSIKGVGGKLSTDLNGVATKLKAEDIKKWLTDAATMEKTLPKKPMMPMSNYLKTSAKLTDADVTALLAYMATLK
jgi:cytochrome c553